MDNPSAFPIADVYSHDGIGLREGSDGMSLRDWFAGQALTRVYASGGRYQAEGLRQCAEQSYAMADAMLAARATAVPDEQPMQHVAYFDEGQFHWMSGRAPRDCELYARAKA